LKNLCDVPFYGADQQLRDGIFVVDYKGLQRRAERVVEEAGIRNPPINPVYLANRAGLDVVYARFPSPMSDEVSGYIEPENRRIVVNRDISGVRQIFTIAHELAHYELHREYAQSENYRVLTRSNSYADTKPDIEKEADAFASYLLVPTPMLKRYQDVGSVRELARAFGVSEDVIRMRMARL